MSGNVTRLDTKSFSDTITAYTRHTRDFGRIVSEVNRTVDTLVGSRWQGLGRDAFGRDSRRVRQNLSDISEIMNEMRDALIAAQAEYADTDRAVAQHYRS